MMNTPTLRKARESDLSEILELFVLTVEKINSQDYSPEQINAWKSSAQNSIRWKNKITSQTFLVAELHSSIVGVCSFENPDYLDILYVHAHYQRKGIAQLLYSEIEQLAIRHGVSQIRSDVSTTAQHFFEKQGFLIVGKQDVLIQNISLPNYTMIKIL